MGQANLEHATAVFSEQRGRLFAIAYNILGEVVDAEDVVQETWLSWAAADHDRIDNPQAYLVRIAVNTSMSHLRRVQRRRETYVGPWLPEPLITAADVADSALQQESVGLARADGGTGDVDAAGAGDVRAARGVRLHPR